MARVRYYYRLCEAEKIKTTYSSWISKKAHLGGGHFEVLKKITIKPRMSRKNDALTETLFTIKFEFTNSKKIDAYLFFINNGLATGIDTTLPVEPLGQE